MNPYTPQQDDGIDRELREIAAQNPPIPGNLHLAIMTRLKVAPQPRAARWPWFAAAAAVALTIAVWNLPVPRPSPKTSTPSLAMVAPKLALPSLPRLGKATVGTQFAQAITSPLRAGGGLTFALRAPQVPERLAP